MKVVDRYCNGVRKKTERLLKKMFGYNSIKVALNERASLQIFLQSNLNKRIEEFTVQDVKKFPYEYAKWRTLDRIISIYLDLVSLDKFIVKELEGGT